MIGPPLAPGGLGRAIFSLGAVSHASLLSAQPLETRRWGLPCCGAFAPLRFPGPIDPYAETWGQLLPAWLVGRAAPCSSSGAQQVFFCFKVLSCSMDELLLFGRLRGEAKGGMRVRCAQMRYRTCIGT